MSHESPDPYEMPNNKDLINIKNKICFNKNLIIRFQKSHPINFKPTRLKEAKFQTNNSSSDLPSKIRTFETSLPNCTKRLQNLREQGEN